MRPLITLGSEASSQVDFWPTLDIWYGDLCSSDRDFIDYTCKPNYFEASAEALERDYARLHVISYAVWRYEGLQDSYRNSSIGYQLREHPLHLREDFPTCWPGCILPLGGRLPGCASIYRLLRRPRMNNTKALLMAMRACLRDTYAYKYRTNIDCANLIIRAVDI